MNDDIVFQDGQTVTTDQIRAYFEYLSLAEQSGDPFPVNFDAIWPMTHSSKSNAKRALVEFDDFHEGEDYLILNSNALRPAQGDGPRREKIVLSIPCVEFFVIQTVQPIFAIYRQRRIAVTEATRAVSRRAAFRVYVGDRPRTGGRGHGV